MSDGQNSATSPGQLAAYLRASWEAAGAPSMRRMEAELGMSRAAMHNWLSGRTVPRAENLGPFAAYLRADPAVVKRLAKHAEPVGRLTIGTRSLLREVRDELGDLRAVMDGLRELMIEVRDHLKSQDNNSSEVGKVQE